MKLTDKFFKQFKNYEQDPAWGAKIVKLVESAPASSERTGLMSMMYHEGIGYPVDLEKSYELAEQASDGGDALGYFMLGFMIDNIETPDQADGGPRQKYDHYDAERFYAKCAEIESRWRPFAVLWLGDYYMDSAQGGDPEIAVEYYESIAKENAEAAEKLSDYYWNLVMPYYIEDSDWEAGLIKWTKVAAKHNPKDYAYRLGWIYADGIGCKPSVEKAITYFSRACMEGSYRAAEALAKINEEYLEAHPDLAEDKKADIKANIEEWKRLAEELYDPDDATEPSYGQL